MGGPPLALYNAYGVLSTLDSSEDEDSLLDALVVSSSGCLLPPGGRQTYRSGNLCFDNVTYISPKGDEVTQSVDSIHGECPMGDSDEGGGLIAPPKDFVPNISEKKLHPVNFCHKGATQAQALCKAKELAEYFGHSVDFDWPVLSHKTFLPTSGNSEVLRTEDAELWMDLSLYEGQDGQLYAARESQNLYANQHGILPEAMPLIFHHSFNSQFEGGDYYSDMQGTFVKPFVVGFKFI